MDRSSNSDHYTVVRENEKTIVYKNDKLVASESKPPHYFFCCESSSCNSIDPEFVKAKEELIKNW